MNSFFTGQATAPTGACDKIPHLNMQAQNAPENYLCPAPLAAAVETAIILGMPLLLTGEPGCGKSQLAYRVAWEMGFPGGVPLRYSVKSTTEAQDLFYSFDAVKRFQVAHKNNASDGEMLSQNFIHYQALGLAILRAIGLQALEAQGHRALWSGANNPGIAAAPQRSVVLIDEIDKAPRDVPNDILNEIENLAFRIPELSLENPIQLGDSASDLRPIIIITSNAERELPEAFLRRCVYFHLDLPPFDNSDKALDKSTVTVEKIIAARFQKRFREHSPFMQSALSFLAYLRRDESNLIKGPSLAEMLNWLDVLAQRLAPLEENKTLNKQDEVIVTQATATVLLKLKEDYQRAGELLEDWLRSTAGAGK